MSFNHKAGTASSIADWFSIFEDWVTNTLEWTVESGSGTTNLVLSSPGEQGLFTKLFVNVYKDPALDQVWSQVQDDAAGTHKTTYVLSYAVAGAGAFLYWMSGDRDSFIYCFLTGGAYDAVYAGIIEPFALNPTDETYHSCVSWGVRRGTLLRNYDDTWNPAQIFNYWNTRVSDLQLDRLTSELAIGGVYLGQNDAIAGQYKHISCRIQAAGVSQQQTFETKWNGYNTTWVVLSEQSGYRFAMRTGGDLPLGWGDGAHLSFTNGIASTYSSFIAILKAFLESVGWTCTDITDGILAYSAGESGTETIYVKVWYAGATLNILAQDDADGTHVTATYTNAVEEASYPCQYWITADRNFIILAQEEAGAMKPLYGGMFNAAAPSLPTTPYKVAVGCALTAPGSGSGGILRGHNGLWGQSYSVEREVAAVNSSPNLFDGVTYIHWPFTLYSVEFLGDVPYMKYAGGTLNVYDTITAGAAKYTALNDPVGGLWLLRTA